MKDILLIYMAEDALSETEQEQCYMEYAQLGQTLHAKGKFLPAAQKLALTKFAL